MTFNDIKSAVKDFFETLANTFKEALKSIKEKLSQDNSENDEDVKEQENTRQKEQKNSSAENFSADKKSNAKTKKSKRQQEEKKSYSEEYQIKTKNSYSTWQAVKSYIPIFADFFASLFYIAIVVLILKPSLLKETTFNTPTSLLDRFIHWLGMFIKLHNFQLIVRFLICYVLLKLLVVIFSKITYKKIVPILLILLQIVCLSLLIIKFEADKIWTIPNLLLFTPFALLVYITFQQTCGCSGHVIAKKLKNLFALTLIGYSLAHIIFVSESREYFSTFIIELYEFIRTLAIPQQ